MFWVQWPILLIFSNHFIPHRGLTNDCPKVSWPKFPEDLKFFSSWLTFLILTGMNNESKCNNLNGKVVQNFVFRPHFSKIEVWSEPNLLTKKKCRKLMRFCTYTEWIDDFNCLPQNCNSITKIIQWIIL